jgi:Xaa-Pro aminopeptidase
MLEPGMIISTDCPVMDAGIGGSAHLEDSVVITATGMEPLNDTGDQTILV